MRRTAILIGQQPANSSINKGATNDNKDEYSLYKNQSIFPTAHVVIVVVHLRRGDRYLPEHPGQSRPPADPAWVPWQQWRAVEGGWLRRRRQRLDTDTRWLLLQLTYLRLWQSTNLNGSFLGELLDLNSTYIILGVQLRLKLVKGSFPLLSGWGKTKY